MHRWIAQLRRGRRRWRRFCAGQHADGTAACQHDDTMFSTGLEGTAAAAKVFGTSCGWMRTASCAVSRQRDVILSRAGWDGRLRTAVVCVSVRMVFALVGHDRALRGRGTPCARLACVVVASCASNNLLSDLAGAGAEGPLFTASATAARSRPARDRFTHQC